MIFSIVGTAILALSLLAVLYAIGATWCGRRGDERTLIRGRLGLYVTTCLLGAALLLLMAAFLADQFQVRYVAAHSSRQLPFYFKISAIWSGQQGSLLLWSFLQALFAALAVARPPEQARRLAPWATLLLGLLVAFFLAVTLLTANPFATAAPPPDGQGLNPLLRHLGMVLHPPALYLGFVGLAVPFAWAMAALITGQIEGWVAAAHPWTLAAWLFLGLGLLLGMRWAYDVLGWGGYWGWDAVENAGLLPWLIATALLHSMAMPSRMEIASSILRPHNDNFPTASFNTWNLALAVTSFVTVLLGVFIARSGMIRSVHAYARSNLGWGLLGLIGLIVAGAAWLFYRSGAAQRSLLRTPEPDIHLLSRDGLGLLTLITFCVLAVSVLIGTLLPTVTEALTGKAIEIGAAWFDRTAGIQFALLAFLLGVCPLIGQSFTARRRLEQLSEALERQPPWLQERAGQTWKKLVWQLMPALLAMILAGLIAAWAGFTKPLALLGFALAGLAGGAALTAMIANLRRRASLQEKAHSLGSSLAHLGVALMAVGAIGTRMYTVEKEILLDAGKPVQVAGYTLIYEGMQRTSGGDRVSVQASVVVYRDLSYRGMLLPRQDGYAHLEQAVTTPAIRTELRQDLYLVLTGWTEDEQTIGLNVFVNPLISFLWLGGLLLLAGGALVLCPRT